MFGDYQNYFKSYSSLKLRIFSFYGHGAWCTGSFSAKCGAKQFLGEGKSKDNALIRGETLATLWILHWRDLEIFSLWYDMVWYSYAMVCYMYFYAMLWDIKSN